MLSKFLAAAVLGSALIAVPAMAQSNNKMNAAPTKAATTSETASAAGLWQGSKLVGLNVYNDANEKIGAIKELMVDKSGNIASAVIGVGGFLGMGERDVAVKFADLKWSTEPVSSTTTGTNTTNRPATTGTNTTNRPAMTGTNTTNRPATTGEANSARTYPDHAVFNASKDQLKAMAQFDYNK